MMRSNKVKVIQYAIGYGAHTKTLMRKHGNRTVRVAVKMASRQARAYWGTHI